MNVPAPRKAQFSIGGLKTARSQIGHGDGTGEGKYLSIDHKTGEWTIGQERTPFDFDMEYGILLPEIMFGYYIFKGKNTPDKTNMIPMISQKPKPVPADGIYTDYPEDGPRDMLEIKLHPTDASGGIDFAPTGKSGQNRIASLIDDIVKQEQLPGGRVGFTNPIIKGVPNSWDGKYGTTHHFDYKIVDWVDASGELRQSEWEKTARIDEEPAHDPETGEVFDPLG